MKRNWVAALILLASLSPGGSQTKRNARPPGTLFVDVSEADYIQVIDLGTRQVVDKIVVGKHPHGLVLGQQVVGGKRRLWARHWSSELWTTRTATTKVTKMI